ncbi:hypothetical protein [Halodesulfovibrio sp. MK-HDV]|jgi:hypothetical protein|uniref:hypothetical protein n=1 Tax=Halodesulfovibrio sp. MK-HDV TaxID=2599925 RepID=UPI00136AE9F1|nr:hypothetical protein [Halodesulfovibrio sp. MK-HDV]KAF1073749.1 hypothetical protein MKHDV_03370 [Halodesulfovibrio sp. MK-HDV]
MDAILAEMEFEALANGEFITSAEGVRNIIVNKSVLLLDVHTGTEAPHCSYPFAKNIPLEKSSRPHM